MKQISLIAVLLMFTVVAVATPSYAFAKNGGNYGHSNSHYQDDDYDDDEDEDEDSDESNDSLEIEADVFTDTTIVKVELKNSNKTVFSTDADTRAEVVAVVVDRFNLTTAEVEAALDFEVEDRASRPQDRAKLTGVNKKPLKVCVGSNSSSTALRIEVDVFTDTTIVKVEKNGTTTVFETSATTSSAVAEVIANRFTTLSISQIKSALDFEVEDRASQAKDYRISSNSDKSGVRCYDKPVKDKEDVKNPSDTSSKELLNRIEKLQKLVETLISLLTSRLGQ